MTKAMDLIARAMRRAGILAAGESPAADETMDALAILNGILEQWSIDSLSVFQRKVEVINPTGAPSFTIGPSGDVVTDRPAQPMLEAFTRFDGLDTPISIVSLEFYNSVPDKQSAGRPEMLAFSPGMPNSTVFLWPVPDAGYELHLTVARQFERLLAPADELELPPGYDRALFLTLAVDLCVEFQRPVPEGLVGLAIEAVASIKRNNIAPVDAVFDAALRCGRSDGWLGFRSGT